MKRSLPFRRSQALLTALALTAAFTLPASAFFWNKKEESPSVADFSKNGLIGSVISFSAEDFAVQDGEAADLTSITIDTLPDPQAGTLVIGGQPLEAGTVVDRSALSGLRSQRSTTPAVTTTASTFTPPFPSGPDRPPATAPPYLLTEENLAPIARNMDLSTYKNVAITSYFDAVDGEGDTLTFQLTSTPARGEVTLAEDGSSQFVYTPYENKTGKDSFTYVALDPAGNVSAEATVSVRIEKADTQVTYADMAGSSAHKAAIRLAEEGIYVGKYVDGQYFFCPDQTVSRAEFLTIAMAAAGLEPLEDVTLTGFADDEAIPTWAKGFVSAALQAGAIQGSRDENGAPVFDAGNAITQAEATVMLNSLLDITDVPAEVFFSEGEQHWAAQAAANLTASGILETANAATLSQEMTLGEAAEMLDGALDVLAAREDGGWLPW